MVETHQDVHVVSLVSRRGHVLCSRLPLVGAGRRSTIFIRRILLVIVDSTRGNVFFMGSVVESRYSSKNKESVERVICYCSIFTSTNSMSQVMPRRLVLICTYEIDLSKSADI